MSDAPEQSGAPEGSEAAEAIELAWPSRIEAIAAAADAVAAIARRCAIPEDEAFAVDLAVREAVANAVVHGNRQDAAKRVRVAVRIAVGELEIMVHDDGIGFDAMAIPDPTAAAQLLRSSGRGCHLVRHVMDQATWWLRPEGGTTVRMTKRWRVPDAR